MAGQLKVDSINADSNLSFRIANTAVAFIDSNGLRPTSGNVSLDSTGTTGVGSPSANTLVFYTAGTEDVRIDSSGRLGIGTTSPQNTLEVYNGSDTQIRVRNGALNTQSYDFGRSGSTGLLNFYGNQTGFTGYVFGGVDGTRMTIDSSGYITKPSQPAFLASNTTLAYTGTTSSTPFGFNNTTYNIGSGFNTSTFRFTAPIAGRYLFYFSFFFDASVGTSNADALYYVNGTQLSGGTAATLASRPGQDRITVGNTIILNLNASDYVDVRGRDGTGTGNGIYGPHSYFGGYLIG